jgi:hypothetical protein
MANPEEGITLSKAEQSRLVKLSNAPLERALEQLARVRATLQELDPGSGERDALLERVQLQRERIEELRRLRIAKLGEVIRESKHNLLVPLGDPRKFLAFMERCLGPRRGGRAVPFEPFLPLLEATFGLRLLPTKVRLTKFLLAIAGRWRAKNLAPTRQDENLFPAPFFYD